ncbi:MAG: prenyltransferase/squalene oxidase repeat-containing protein [Bacillota bacterium]|nr:prenyltransferase/squalene oxidase repeat-containing protein [Bacillota bacterium]
MILGQNPENSQAIKKAIDYLKSCQEYGGGFNSGNNWLTSGSNAASTSWVLQGLIAAGEYPSGDPWIKGSNTPVSFLLNLQDEDGFYNWKPDVEASPVTITAHTMMAFPLISGRLALLI